MEKIDSIDTIRQLVAEVRAKRKGFLTNFYLDVEKHSIWINREALFFICVGDTYFIIRKKEAFWNVYFVSTGLDDLEHGLEFLKSKFFDVAIMFDIIGKKDQYDLLLKLFQRCGYEFSNTLVKMTRISSHEEHWSVHNNVSLASISQIQEIERLLYQFFDDKTEQIPYYEELVTYTTLGHVLVTTENDKVTGFLIYEQNPSILYLRYWFVHPDYRNKNIGSHLMNAFLERGKNTKRQLLWVMVNNENAQNRYRHYGFKEEDMYDFIMTNKQ